MPTVAFQGVHGAYSEEAIRMHFGDSVETVPCPLLGDVFDAVERGKATYGMVPVENSVAGTVASAYELLMEHDLRVQAEVVLHVHHALLAPPGTKISEIKIARSHIQALTQCEQYLVRRGIKPLAHYDTAGSAQDLAQEPIPGVAAIASRLAGKLYGLDVLEHSIEDEPQNYTRMFVIGNGDPKPGAKNKTSIVFAMPDRAGSLYSALGEFASRNINLTKIESKPRRNKPWQYYFFVDFEGHFQEPDAEAALASLLRSAAILKVLGSYPVANSSAAATDASVAAKKEKKQS
ncbi:MAG: prephenate dehydratase [Anaerolineae bacterium]|nr:prephenate dehydratase [Anaerolineae bacterium]